MIQMYFDETNNYFDVYKTDLDNLTNINIENISFNRASQLRTPLDGLNKGIIKFFKCEG